MIATAVKTFLPVAHHGCFQMILFPSVDVLAALAETRWNHHLEHPPEQLNVQTFLTQMSWTSITARIVSTFLTDNPHLEKRIYTGLAQIAGRQLPLMI